jgi:general secretion pathway protein D
LIQDEERKSRVSVPILGDIPVLGELFSSTTKDVITTEIVLTITPRIVRNVNVPPVNAQAFWSGTEATYATTPLFPEIARKTSFKSSSAAPSPSSSPIKGEEMKSGSGQGESAPSPAAGRGDRGEGLVAGGAAVLAIRPPELSAFAGQEFAVELLADNVESLQESTVTVTYDAKVLEFKRAVEGELLTRNSAPASVTIISASPAGGQMTLRFRREGAPAAGSGALGRLFFQGRAPGSSAVDIQNATVSGAGAKPIPVTVRRGLVKVR